MKRERLPELMDDPGLEERAHANALRSLNRINRVLGADEALYEGVRRIARGRPASILDLGCGGGGFLAYGVEQMDGTPVPPFVALDRSAFAVRCAVGWHQRLFLGLVADARRVPLVDNAVDIVTCSLFLHHFDPEDAIRVLAEARRVARLGVVVSDLLRSRLALAATWSATRVFSRSRVFHVDGPRSVRAAFRADELAELADGAGLKGASVEGRFPFRLLLIWEALRDADENRAHRD